MFIEYYILWHCLITIISVLEALHTTFILSDINVLNLFSAFHNTWAHNVCYRDTTTVHWNNTYTVLPKWWSDTNFFDFKTTKFIPSDQNELNLFLSFHNTLAQSLLDWYYGSLPEFRYSFSSSIKYHEFGIIAHIMYLEVHSP